MFWQNVIGDVAAKPACVQDKIDVLSEKNQYQDFIKTTENDIKISLRIIHLVGKQKFLKN